MKYIIKKFIALIITLLVISLLTFVAFSLIPGDAVMSRLGINATPEAVANMRESLGLDKPVALRYFSWLAGVLHGDFGQSLKYSTMTVADLMRTRLLVTLILAVMSLIIIVAVSFPLGMLTAKYAGKWQDTVITQVNQVIMSIPSFFLGIILTVVFGLIFKVFDVGGYVDPSEDFWGCVSFMILPAVAVALPKIAMVVKYIRNSVVTELKQDYVRTAYSKGAGPNRVLYKHVFRNAMIPVVTFIAMVMAEILAGSLVIEQVFNIPGLGRLLVSSITSRDYPVVQAAVLYITAIVVILNFIVDVIYQIADPRIRNS